MRRTGCLRLHDARQRNAYYGAVNSALKNFTLRLQDFSTFGSGLTRPECVRADSQGVWASDDRGGIARVTQDGVAEIRGEGIFEPNGYSRAPDGAFIVAGLKDNKVFRIDPSGRTSVLLDNFQGRPLGTVNTAWVDTQGRIWVSMMTRREHWYDALNSPPDGYILLIEGGRARIVADQLHLTNEVKVHPSGEYLYGVETLGKRIFRYPIAANGDLGKKELFGPLGITSAKWGGVDAQGVTDGEAGLSLGILNTLIGGGGAPAPRDTPPAPAPPPAPAAPKP